MGPLVDKHTTGNAVWPNRAPVYNLSRYPVARQTVTPSLTLLYSGGGKITPSPLVGEGRGGGNIGGRLRLSRSQVCHVEPGEVSLMSC